MQVDNKSYPEKIAYAALYANISAVAMTATTNPWWYMAYCWLKETPFSLRRGLTIGLRENWWAFAASNTVMKMTSTSLLHQVERRGYSLTAPIDFSVNFIAGIFSAMGIYWGECKAVHQYVLKKHNIKPLKIHPLKILFRSKGWKGLAPGLVPTLLRDGIGNTIVFCGSRYIHNLLASKLSDNLMVTTTISSLLSGAMAIALTNELQKVRIFRQSNAWIQAYKIPGKLDPSSYFAVCKKSWYSTGRRGFFMSMIPRGIALCFMTACNLGSDYTCPSLHNWVWSKVNL